MYDVTIPLHCFQGWSSLSHPKILCLFALNMPWTRSFVSYSQWVKLIFLFSWHSLTCELKSYSGIDLDQFWIWYQLPIVLSSYRHIANCVGNLHASHLGKVMRGEKNWLVGQTPICLFVGDIILVGRLPWKLLKQSWVLTNFQQFD